MMDEGQYKVCGSKLGNVQSGIYCCELPREDAENVSVRYVRYKGEYRHLLLGHCKHCCVLYCGVGSIIFQHGQAHTRANLTKTQPDVGHVARKSNVSRNPERIS